MSVKMFHYAQTIRDSIENVKNNNNTEINSDVKLFMRSLIMYTRTYFKYLYMMYVILFIYLRQIYNTRYYILHALHLIQLLQLIIAHIYGSKFYSVSNISYHLQNLILIIHELNLPVTPCIIIRTYFLERRC